MSFFKKSRQQISKILQKIWGFLIHVKSGYYIFARSATPIQELQKFLKSQELWGCLISHNDAFFNEFISPDCDQLEWLMGFTGSAGLGLVTQDQAWLFVDARYLIQAQNQVTGVYIESIGNFKNWLQEKVPLGSRVAYDPWLHSMSEIQDYEVVAQKSRFYMKALSPHPIDLLWKDRPVVHFAPLTVHPLLYAGQDSKSKRFMVSRNLFDADMVLLTKGDSISWLLNIRGGDVPYTPIPKAYVILYANGRADLFIDPLKVTSEIVEHISSEVQVFPFEIFKERFASVTRGAKVVLDPSQTPDIVKTFIQDADEVFYESDPCLLPKAIKNSVEIQNHVQAHQVDGIALTKFLYWIAHLPLDGQETEFSAAQKLLDFRKQGQHFRGLSFQTISAFQSNSAIIHYQPNERLNQALKGHGLYLVDSGGQYCNGGTTDVTRVIALGPPNENQKERYTQVLKGHIDLAQIVFPRGTRGSHLDVLARQHLWAIGLDCPHAIGHGVGSYLSVHEGPQSISRRDQVVSLEPGMILSNEPGVYEAGAYGIRLENLMMVLPIGSGEMLGFETLTLLPFDPLLILSERLTPEQKAWLNSYHQKVYKTLAPDLEEEIVVWLQNQTMPL